MNDRCPEPSPCDDCVEAIALPWQATPALWDAVVGDLAAMLCPNCFEVRARARGVLMTDWIIDLSRGLNEARPH